MPLGCALVTWFYYHFQGIRENGFGYIKNFLGPVWWLASADVPHRGLQPPGANSVAHHPSFRQHVCQRHGDPGVLSLFPIGIPVIFMLLHVGVAIIQTYIFVLLATVYIGEAVAHEH